MGKGGKAVVDVKNENQKLLDVENVGISSSLIYDVKWLQDDDVNIIIYNILCLLSLGVLPLIVFFYPIVRLKYRTAICGPENAKYIILEIKGRIQVDNLELTSEERQVGITESIEIYYGPVKHMKLESGERIIVTELNAIRYCASSVDNYELYKLTEVPVNFKRFLNPGGSQGKPDQKMLERDILVHIYGHNKIVVPETNIWEIALRWALHPIFLFEYFAAIIWFIEDYIAYAILILVVTVLAVYLLTVETAYNLTRLRELAGQEKSVRVLDGTLHANKNKNKHSHEWESLDYRNVLTVPDSTLVPGDRFLIQEGTTLPCDAILISGRVIVDESMLTGESIPVSKQPVDFVGIGGIEDNNEPLMTGASWSSRPLEGTEKELDLSVKRSGNVLVGGTKVRASLGECIAVCYRTGFRSTKGKLIASLLTPKEGFLLFFRDILWVALFMFLLASLLFVYEGIVLYNMGVRDGELALKYFDALTVAIPIGLIACLAISTSLSIGRLKSKNIYVSDTSRVNWAGMCSFVCFDKTGTLTEEKLDFKGVCLSRRNIIDKNIDKGTHVDDDLVEFGSDVSVIPDLCIEIMATCHNLTLLVGSEPLGDLLEVELLRASAWTLDMSKDGSGKIWAMPPNPTLGRYEILRHFEFTADKLRTATLFRRPNNDMLFVMKGSPETIISLCEQSSVPPSINQTLGRLAKRGFRVIAIASRDCNESIQVLERLSQDSLEGMGGIKFIGLIFLTSKLKAAAKPTVAALTKADVGCSMITGDYIHTAIAIAEECGIFLKKLPGDFMFIVDEEDGTGRTVIIDAITDKVVDMRMEKMLDMASLTYNPSSIPKTCCESLIPILQPNKSTTVRTHALPLVQIAITVKGLLSALKNYPPHVVNSLIRYTRVFARMKPEHKKYIVEEIMLTHEWDQFAGVLATVPSDPNKSGEVQLPMSTPPPADNEMGFFDVIFCGDGGNDMLALRASTVGVSLCDTETSVAAPVTSKIPTPGAVIDLILEGRATLIATYSLVHFNIFYAVIQIFFMSFLYGYGLMATDSMYWIQDLLYTLALSVALILTPATKTVSAELPPKRYFTRWLMAVAIPQIIIFPCIQVAALWILSLQDFYVKYETDDPFSELNIITYESTVLDDIVLGQLMIAGIVSAIGEPYRIEWYRDPIFTGILLFDFIWLLYQIFQTGSDFATDVLQLETIPTYFGFYILGILTFNLLLSSFFLWIGNKFRYKRLRTLVPLLNDNNDDDDDLAAVPLTSRG